MHLLDLKKGPEALAERSATGWKRLVVEETQNRLYSEKYNTLEYLITNEGEIERLRENMREEMKQCHAGDKCKLRGLSPLHLYQVCKKNMIHNLYDYGRLHLNKRKERESVFI